MSFDARRCPRGCPFPRVAERAAAARGRARHGTPRGRRPPAAGHRRRRIRQDQHARLPRRAPGAQRCRPAADPAAHVQPPGGGRDGASGGTAAAARTRRFGCAGRRRVSLGGHVPQRRGPPAARVRSAHRARRVLHDPRSRRCGRPDRDRAARARPRCHRAPLPGQGDVPRDLFPHGQWRNGARRGARTRLSVVHPVAGRSREAVRRLRRREAGAARARLRRPAALLGAHGRRALARARDRRALRPRARRRIPGHQPAAGLDPARDEAGRPGGDGRRRRRPVDLFVPRGDGAQHPRLSAALRAARARGDARSQLPFDPGRSSTRPTP